MDKLYRSIFDLLPMKNLLFLFLIFLFQANCQQKKDYSEIRKKLTAVFIKDQEGRIDIVDWLDRKRKDEENLAIVTGIIDSVGWLGVDEVGDTANSALFLVIQHSNLVTMEKYLPIVKQAVKDKKASNQDLALLTDRIEVANNRPQIYGTQGTIKNNKYLLDSIIDKQNVHKRRKQMGLIPLEEAISLVKEMHNLEK
jgi:hypothetical protein